eukprot:CAMPEP_0197660834 /NCGR_PEP_ID=MMETSP1338-20131121/51086_1 /TAXON_ID=43686 ORGANISM="Pelagodinium beii, Strain RCC1491" /NCGR_SAMPLE_ID=MMETSP1338 /ASSEMBLY_ACC=CAM_ASM_000754 /LENGTH=404 /DNA_ID=CAMNT_0043238267 /DNA_START=27 /DNA_END=1241 /DNA_ORIENTATION=-
MGKKVYPHGPLAIQHLERLPIELLQQAAGELNVDPNGTRLGLIVRLYTKLEEKKDADAVDSKASKPAEEVPDDGDEEVAEEVPAEGDEEVAEEVPDEGDEEVAARVKRHQTRREEDNVREPEDAAEEPACVQEAAGEAPHEGEDLLDDLGGLCEIPMPMKSQAEESKGTEVKSKAAPAVAEAIAVADPPAEELEAKTPSPTKGPESEAQGASKEPQSSEKSIWAVSKTTPRRKAKGPGGKTGKVHEHSKDCKLCNLTKKPTFVHVTAPGKHGATCGYCIGKLMFYGRKRLNLGSLRPTPEDFTEEQLEFCVAESKRSRKADQDKDNDLSARLQNESEVQAAAAEKAQIAADDAKKPKRKKDVEEVEKPVEEEKEEEEEEKMPRRRLKRKAAPAITKVRVAAKKK